MSTSGKTGARHHDSPAPVFPPPGVRAVVFDVVGTLVEPQPTVAVAYQRVAARHGVERNPEEIQQLFKAAWRRQEAIDSAAHPAHATSRSRERDRWRQIVADVFADAAATAPIFDELWDHFGSPSAWRPLAHGSDLMRQALDAGATVALASNFDERLLTIACHVDPLVRAQHVFASSEIGWRKPAAEFFRCIESRLGCQPHELLLVGDDPELDIAAGERAGWHVLRVQ